MVVKYIKQTFTIVTIIVETMSEVFRCSLNQNNALNLATIIISSYFNWLNQFENGYTVQFSPDELA